MANEKILVTGGAGAIGSQISIYLKNNNYDVTIIDNLSSGNFKNLNSDEFNFVKTDIRKPIELDTDFSYIIHAAAFFANQNSVDHPINDLEVNGIGTINVLEFARKNPSLKKLIYLSSSCVYGKNIGQDESAAIDDLETPYAISKYVGEKYCSFYNSQYKLPIVVLRVFNSFGPGEFPGKYRNVIPNFIHSIYTSGKINITGTGDETRDFNFVDNLIQATYLAMKSSDHFDIYNVGSGVETSINELTSILRELTQINFSVFYTENRKWDKISRRLANISKIQKKLNYSPRIDLKSDLGKTIIWYKKHHM
jgi:nucleoside-diphosphate-sugar epimerase